MTCILYLVKTIIMSVWESVTTNYCYDCVKNAWWRLRWGKSSGSFEHPLRRVLNDEFNRNVESYYIELIFLTGNEVHGTSLYD